MCLVSMYFRTYMACETLEIVQHAVASSYLIFRHFNKDDCYHQTKKENVLRASINHCDIIILH